MVTKLDRLARSLPDARAIADELTARQISLSLGGSVYDPTDAVGRLLFNVLAMVAEFESDLIRLRTVEGMKVAKTKGRLRGKIVLFTPTQSTPSRQTALFTRYSDAELADLERHDGLLGEQDFLDLQLDRLGFGVRVIGNDHDG